MSSPRGGAAKAGAPQRSSTRKDAATRTNAPDPTQEPSRSEKAAFLKAMARGIKPGTLAAKKSAAKKSATQKSAAERSAARNVAPGAKSAKKPAAVAAAPKVEVLRRISGNAAVQLTPDSEQALALARRLEAALADGNLDLIQPHALQALMAALCKIYAAKDEVGERYPVLSGRGAVTGTDVMIVCGALLKAVDLQVFELGMWQSWSGR